MADKRISAFVTCVLTGLYRDRKDKRILLLALCKNDLADVFGGKTLGSAQKQELRDTCRENDIGVSEFKDYFLFFAPSDTKELTADLGHLKEEIKALTAHFAENLESDKVDEDWEGRQFPSLNPTSEPLL
jgi:hypothetical protein